MTSLLPRLTPERAEEVARGEVEALVDVLRSLDPFEWDLPTDCTRWTVRDIVAHVNGAMDEGAHVRVLLRHLALARRGRSDLAMLDAINEMQIHERRGATPEELVAELAVLGPRTARARRRMPRLLRGRPVPGDNGLPAGSTFGYLVDVIYPRDVWMHRIDVCRATGRALSPTATEADVVAEVVRDLAGVWDGPTTTLTLTGHGAGPWTLGSGSPRATLEADAVEVCRMLSGRPASPFVTLTGDPEAESRLLAARVAF
jgi:uncharacterized protein (TIGR03083 family)